MTLPRKGNYTLRTLRTRDDHDLFKITLPRYDSKVFSDILLLVQPGQTLKPQQPIVLLTCAPSQTTQSPQGVPCLPEQVQLGSHVAGVIQRVGSSFGEDEGGWRLREQVKGWQLQLCHLRACQHIIQKQSINDSLIRKEGAPICQNCLKPIWIYLHPDILTITPQDLLNHNPDLTFSDLNQLEWTIVLNEQFTPTTSIAKASDKDIHYPLLAKAVYLLGEGEKPTHNSPILKVQKLLCRHEKVVEHRCQYCLQVLEAQELGQFNRYLFQLGKDGSKGLARGSALAQQEQEYISGLANKSKAILILDLDNTILHSCQMNELTLPSLLKLKQYFVMPKLQQIEGKVKQDFIVVKIRPFFEEFLFTINQLFELYVYTKGTRIYAEQICRWVRHKWAGDPSPYDLPTWPNESAHHHFLKDSQCFSPHRLISRNEDTSLDTKSMQNILPTRTEYHLILDDRRDVWANSPSWFYTRDYYYFIKRSKQSPDVAQDFLEPSSTSLGAKLMQYYTRMRQDYPPKQEYQLQLAQRQDFFLLYTCHALKKIHHHFFRHLQKHKETENKNSQKNSHPVSIAGVMQKAKLFLIKKKLRFFLAPGDEGISTTRRALKMGAIVLKPNCTQTPDFVIRGNSFVKYVRQQPQKKEEPEQKEPFQQQTEKGQVQDEIPPQSLIEQKSINTQQKQATAQHPKKETQVEIKKEHPNEINYQKQLQLLQQYKDKGLPIIAETWILASYQFSYKFKWQDFALADPLREQLDHSEFNNVLEKEALKIRSEIRQQMGYG